MLFVTGVLIIMNQTERQIHATIYKLMTPDWSIVPIPSVTDKGEDYLKELLDKATKNNRKELNKLVAKRTLTRKEATEILVALGSLSGIKETENYIAAVYLELSNGEIQLHSVASNGGTKN